MFWKGVKEFGGDLLDPAFGLHAAGITATAGLLSWAGGSSLASRRQRKAGRPAVGLEGFGQHAGAFAIGAAGLLAIGAGTAGVMSKWGPLLKSNNPVTKV